MIKKSLSKLAGYPKASFHEQNINPFSNVQWYTKKNGKKYF